MDNLQFYSVLAASSLVEMLGILTLLTNDGIIPDAELGFSIPVLLISADIQGFALLITGSALVVGSIVGKSKSI